MADDQRRVARSFYSASISHNEVPGLYLATFGIPGSPAMYVYEGGRPKEFRSAQDAELAGFKVMMSKLNRALNVQDFHTKRDPNKQIKSWKAQPDRREPTAEQIFKKRS